MVLRINGKIIENPIAIIALVLFSIGVVGAILAFCLFVLLPLIGIVLSGALVIAVAIITPIIFWFVIPIVMLSIIGWCFGKLFK